MAKKVLIKPMITEKSSALTDDYNKYTFKVDKAANKVEIKKAIEAAYNVQVEDVKTLIMPSKAKVRNTKRGVQRGRKSSYKKAIITLAFGEEIDLYGDI
ncbi:MAG: 50S ribosomal protein L23 [Bacteroidota bacterium]